MTIILLHLWNSHKYNKSILKLKLTVFNGFNVIEKTQYHLTFSLISVIRILNGFSIKITY